MSVQSDLSLNLRVEYSEYWKYLNRIQSGTATARDHRLLSSSIRAINRFKADCERVLEPMLFPPEYNYPDPQEPEEPPKEQPKTAQRSRTQPRKVSKSDITILEQLSLF